MMRTRGSSILTDAKRRELILNLCRSFITLQTPEEAAQAFTDLLTPKEIETIGKRLEIAEMLVKQEGYETIRKELKVGYSTIARINTWLNLAGEGFHMMLDRRKPFPKEHQVTEDERYNPYSWHNVKRRYSLYFWPQLLLEELVKQSNTQERRKIDKILDTIDMKRREFSRANNKELYEMFSKKLSVK